MLSKGSVDINQGTPQSGWTPLMLATFKGFAPVVQVLLAEGASVSVVGDQGFTALHVASQEGHLAITNLLLNVGAHLEAQTCDGFTPLHCAQQRGSVEIARALIGAGANVDARSSRGQTPLYGASRLGQMKMAKVLLRANANPLLGVTKTATGSIFVPLEVAAEHGHLGVVSELVQHVGIEGCGGSSVGAYALQAAAREQHVEVMEILADAGVVDAGLALNVAARFGREASVKFLLQRQQTGHAGQVSYLNHTRHRLGKSPLVEGVDACSPRIIRLLLDAGADPTSVVRVTHPKSESIVVFHGTALELTELLLREKYVCGEPATEEQLHQLTAIRRLLMRVDAVHALPLLWPPSTAAPFIAHASAPAPAAALAAPTVSGERRPSTTSNPLTAMLPILRGRAGRRGALLAAQWRWVLPMYGCSCVGCFKLCVPDACSSGTVPGCNCFVWC